MEYIQAFGWTENTGIESPHAIFIHGKDLPEFLTTPQEQPVITISETADIVVQNITIPQWIYKIYSTNLNVEPSKKCCAIPYGVLPRQARLIEQVEQNQKKEYLLYLNFATYSHYKRPYIYQILKNKPFIYDRVDNEGQKQNTDEACLLYYNNIARSKFVLCPRGNGIDTYRMWECLYLGSIPVVEKSLFTAHFRNKLPILEIENWNNIDENLLLYYYNKTKTTQWKWEMLDRQYWINQWKKDIEVIRRQ